MPKFSIVIPVYNVEDYLAECLDSVLVQTFKDFEVICVNDGSTDKSGEILKSYAQKDDRIKIIYKENGGLSSARNEGLKYINGELCYFLDSDDYIESNLLEYAVKIFENYEIDYFAFGSKVFVEGNVIQNIEKMQKYIDIKHDGLLDVTFDVARNCNIHVWNKIFKTEIIQKNKLNFIEGLLYEDIYFVWNYVFLSKKAYFEKGIFHNYRMRSSSIMEKATSNKTLKSGVDHMLNWYELFKKVLENKKIFAENFNNLTTLLKSYTNRTKEMIPTEDNHFVDRLNKKYLTELNSKKVTEVQTIHKIEYTPLEKLFSVKITPDKEYKIIRCTFIKIRVKNNKVRQMPSYAKKKLKEITADNYSIFCKSNNINEDIISILKELNNFKFLPNRGNLGDMAIGCACYQLFDSLALNYNVFDILDLNKETKNQFDLVYGGGGLFTSHYRKYYQEILEVFKSQNLKKAVILPASFYDCDDVLECLDERFTVFCREEQSFNYCKSKNNKAKFFLAKDMVISLNTDFISSNIIDLKIIKENQKKADKIQLFKLYKYYLDCISKYNRALRLSKNIGYFFRTDKESVKDIKKEIYSVIDLSLCANSFCADKAFTIIMVKEFFNVLNKFEYIVSDRLHIGICSMLLNKKVHLLDNSFKKVSNVLKESIEENKNISIYNNFDEILNVLEKSEDETITFEKIEPMSFKDFLTLWLSIKNNFGAEKKYWGEIL